ncbi:hypothetical protein DQ04_10491000, partial [Trypanosoma grayi]|uniref:hypothetical protein n=1 Tax=Trypanosoma grayi TaxID=71804 RepID=UPI0004F443DD
GRCTTPVRSSRGRVPTWRGTTTNRAVERRRTNGKEACGGRGSPVYMLRGTHSSPGTKRSWDRKPNQSNENKQGNDDDDDDGDKKKKNSNNGGELKKSSGM